MVLSVEAAERNTILSPGDMLGGYRIEDFLGRGGFGVTYLALDTQLDLLVAIKEYLPEQIAERTINKAVQPKSETESSTFSWGLTRFIKEAQTLAKFKHPSIVRVMAVFEQNGTAYMVMEYERGQELKEVIRSRNFCSEANLQKIIGPVIDGLAEVHRHGYIHRDIKPANILIREDGSPVLLDFGSARLATGAQTQSLTALVSVGYAPLEQYNDANDSQQGPWTDVYALGAVLYFAITGNVPVDSTLRGSAVVNDQRDPLVPLMQVAPEGISPAFCQAVDWALSFRIRDRPQTLDQWRSTLLDEQLPGGNATTLLPPVSTRTLDREVTSPGGYTARNQSMSARHEAQDRVVERTRPTHGTRTGTSSRRAEHYSEDVSVNSSAVEPEWDTRRERELHQARPRPVKSMRYSRRKKSRAPMIIGLCAASMTAVAVVTKNQWLPTVEHLLPGSSDAQTASLAGSGQNTTNQILENATTVSAVSTNADMTNAELAAQAEANRLASAEREKQQVEAARLREEQRQKLQIEETEARLAAEKLQREKEQAEAEAAQKAAEQAAAEADRLARNRATQLAEDAARQARVDARLAAAETARLAEEQAIKDREAEKQILAEKNQLALLESPETPAQSAANVKRPITDADIKSVLDQFNSLRKAITNKDEAALDALTLPSERKSAYIKYLFRTFDSIEVSLGGVGASPGEQTVRANLQMIRMKRSNGDIVYPPAEFKKIPIHSVRTTEWSKIHW